TARAVLRAIELRQIDVVDAVRDRLAVDAAEAARRADAAVLLREDLPARLAELPDSPDLLYIRGQLPAAAGVAIVGTRRATTYGLRLARSFGHAVAAAGWPVISGLARGIDGAAHIGCLDAGGIGVAVLGCGIDVAYPSEHRRLATRLLEGGGAVVSEYAPGAPPEGWRFPPRNRIISGLAPAVVVVEAGVKGGALITAARGLEQGRLVLAVPGDIGRETSRGTNLLIRDGAHPVLDVDDLLTSLTFVLGAPPRPPATMAATDDPILGLVRGGGMTLEALAGALDCSASELIGRVSLLEATGAVRNEGGVISVRT
ncbi:MAG: DNA-protecting protein DprA, partial [Acidimicrobiia bacterium]|nr:DNA-protecting protein DprA [Acidimicrobiia bacterium]